VNDRIEAFRSVMLLSLDQATFDGLPAELISAAANGDRFALETLVASAHMHDWYARQIAKTLTPEEKHLTNVAYFLANCLAWRLMGESATELKLGMEVPNVPKTNLTQR